MITATAAAREGTVQLRDGLLRYPVAITEDTVVGHLLESRLLISRFLEYFRLDHMLGDAMADLTFVVLVVFHLP